MLPDDEVVGTELADDYTDPVPRLHHAAFIGEGQPIPFACLECAGSRQSTGLPRRHGRQCDISAWVDQGRLFPGLMERFSPVWVEYAVTKTNGIARLHGLDTERVNTPGMSVVLTRLSHCRMCHITIWNRPCSCGGHQQAGDQHRYEQRWFVPPAGVPQIAHTTITDTHCIAPSWPQRDFRMPGDRTRRA